ncbi:chromosome segregation protein SMC [Lacihabitans sp. CCS-44]|uniref:AAA family ATPase n=1 Tax=Lacihabitans sp. CCS-44 TaxID=2487331 RepID=UPI0020CECF33|nr:AAA family ATPase [Lacihabitans sp. CCS-44]MCP9756818.1 chromosome segregation protein SMC [Lacihabitans sp. CCS-44]
MKIKSLNIKNFKSIVDITINEPNPFTVFVGPNGSGKSNIFEALEILKFSHFNETLDLFGGMTSVINKNSIPDNFAINFEYLDTDQSAEFDVSIQIYEGKIDCISSYVGSIEFDSSELKPFEVFNKISRIFVGNERINRIINNSNNKLSNSCQNLEKVLKRLLEDELIREEISDWLSLFIPEFDRIEVQKSQFSSNEDLLIYQKHYDKPFNKELISDGTYNIIALLTAVYQSDEPQFLCIEEPENGLHPKVIKQLVNFFRNACEEKGHYIWLNTHSQTLVSQLTPEEIILVDKEDGETKISQVKGFNTHGLEMDEAWLSNALGGGLPW